MKRFFFLLASTLVVLFGAVQAFHTQRVSAIACCNVSTDCSGDSICCDPMYPMRNCGNPPNVGYCQGKCSE